MNYGQLKSQVAARLHRTDLTSVIPEFIEAARVRIGADLRSLSNYEEIQLTGFSASGFAHLPTDFAEMVNIRTYEWVPLKYLPPDEVAYHQGELVYSITGASTPPPNIQVPGAGTSSAYVMCYYSIPAALTLDADETRTMTAYPQLWQYASLLEGALYLQDWELYDRMVDAYQGTLASANRLGQIYGPAPRMIDSGRNVLATGSGL